MLCISLVHHPPQQSLYNFCLVHKRISSCIWKNVCEHNPDSDYVCLHNVILKTNWYYASIISGKLQNTFTVSVFLLHEQHLWLFCFLSFFYAKLRFFLFLPLVLVSSRRTHSIIWLTKPLNLQLCSRLHVGQFLWHSLSIPIYTVSVAVYRYISTQYEGIYNPSPSFCVMLICINKASVSVAKNRAI